MAKKLTIQDMHTFARERGGECISQTYSRNSLKLRWKCSEGHIWDASPVNIRNGTWCPICAAERRRGMRPKTISILRTISRESGGGKLISQAKYRDAKLTWECGAGHTWNSSPAQILKGAWCPTCAGKKKHTLEDMKAQASARGGECLSEAYVNIHAKLKWKCQFGHQWTASALNIRRGSWCPSCSRLQKK